MKKVMLNNCEYDLIRNYKEGFDYEMVNEKFTDYFYEYDYIVGDFAYDKLRLKGFYEHGNKNCNEINDYNNVEEYIKNYCAYECKYFILKKKI